MRLGHIELFVRDTHASKAFYMDVLGFEVVAVQGVHVWLKSASEVEILLRPGKAAPAADDYSAAPAALVLYTDDLAQTAAGLRERGLRFSGNDKSSKCLTFQDPDGHWWQLVNPRDH